MKNSVTNYLTRLGENPRLRLTFARDPNATMSPASLSGPERAALTSGDASAIYRAAGVNERPAPKIIQIPALPA